MLGLFIVVTKVKQRILVLPNTAGKKELYGSNTCLGLWLCDFVRLSVFSGFSDVPLYLTNYSIKLMYMLIIRTSSMRGLK